MAQQFDIVIIGGGNAGFGVSATAGQAGKSLAFVESWDFGGTCPNRGCTPKKVLVAAAHALDEIERAPVHGISLGAASLDWGKLIDREKAMVDFIPDAMAELAAKRGSVFRGRARFVGPKQVQVGDEVLEAEAIVIATGSTPRPLPIPGAELMITSDEVLSEREQPGSVIFIGGGVIAMEFSHVYARAGTEVTILEALPSLLPRADQDAVAAIQAESERIGIAIKTGVAVKSLSNEGGKLKVEFEHEGETQSLLADRVVNGAGRIPNVADLDLDAGEVAHEGLRISLDSCLRSTSNPAVWVCGDAVSGTAQLSPIATYEGQTVGRSIVEGRGIEPDYTALPNCVYTVPAMASVGLTEAEAEAQGLSVTVSKTDMRGWFSGKSYAESVAFAKTLVEEGSGRILGAHLVGHQGEELIHLFAMAMRYGITANQLKEQLFAFPTFSSDMKNVL